ncbi:MAG: SIR2 family protein [Mediterraneibacter sp.]
MDNNISVELLQILKETDEKQTVFWVGAGIDIDTPTCLPSGRELTEFVLKNGFGDNKLSLLDHYKMQCDLINQNCIYAELDGIPRLETVIGVLQRFENQNGKKKIPSFLNGFTRFADAQPNVTHFSLAELLHKGATIVTTNYDLCIPQAYSQLFSECENKLMRRQIGAGIFQYYSSNENVGKLYYIHRIADQIESLGHSLKNVMQSLAGEFYEEIKQKYCENNLFIFLGYSGLDNLDVNLMFESLQRIKKNSRAVCIVYPKAEITDAQIGLLEHFESNYHFEMYLDSFFGHYEELTVHPCEQNTENKKEIWKTEFHSYPKKFHIYFQMALAYELGIGLDVKENELNNNDVEMYLEEWYINFYTSHLRVRKSYFATIKSFFSKTYDKYHRIISDSQIEKAVDTSSGKIGWAAVSPINATVKRLLKIYSIGRIFVPKQKIENIYESVKTMLLHKYEDFDEVREYYVLELCLAMLMAMKSPKNSSVEITGIIKKVSQEYSKVSMLDGVLNAECIYLKTEGILLKAKGTWREWKNYFVRIINYCKLLDQLERRDRILQFWLR